MDDEILEIFFSEAEELIEIMESGLLSLEKDPGDKDQIHSVFRAAHTMKGNAATVGLEQLIHFAHQQENVLDMLRQDRLKLTPDTTSLLLASVDVLRGMLQDVLEGRESDPSRTTPFEEAFRALEAGGGLPERKPAKAAEPAARTKPAPAPEVEDEPAAPPPEPTPPPVDEADETMTRIVVPADGDLPAHTFLVDRGSLEDALFADMRVYAVRVVAGPDLDEQARSAEEFHEQLCSYGQCLDDDLSEEKPGGADAVYHACLATILEETDMVAMALGLPVGRLFSFDPAGLQEALNREEAAPTEGAWPEPEPPTPQPEETPEEAPREAPPQGAPSAASAQAPQDSAEAPLICSEGPPIPPTCAPASQAGPATGGRKIAGIETIRVNVELIDLLMNLAGELVLGRNQLRRMLESVADRTPGLSSVLQNVDIVTSDIQEKIMKMRMQPVGNVLGKFPRLVRDLSLQLGKEVELSLRGTEVELDKSILEALSDPLTHLIRNSVDHAIERPQDREAAGKPRAGRVSIRAFHEEGQVHLTVADDGRGISPEQVLEKALALGLVDAGRARMMSESEKLQLIFLPGFSTAAKVTDVSGRGVGMDVVKTNIEKVGGHLEIDSRYGKGTTIRLRLPLTLAIIPSLVVRTAGQYFAIPQTDVAELVCVEAGDVSHRVERVGDAAVLRLRDRLLPLVRLADELGYTRTFVHPGTHRKMEDRRERIVDRRVDNAAAEAEAEEATPAVTENRRESDDRRRMSFSDIFVVVLRMGQNRFGLIVDELLNTEEIVVKPLQTHIRNSRAFSGTTIMGDGTVAMILSAGGLAETAGLIFGEVGAEERRRQEEARQRERESTPSVPVVIFNNDPHEYFALPLASISRLERIEPGEITRVGRREYAAFRGSGLPLVRLEDHLPVNPAPQDAPELYIIIPRTDGPPAGIVATQIVDTIETDAQLIRGRSQKPGLTGSAILEGNLTLFLNAEELMNLSALTD